MTSVKHSKNRNYSFNLETESAKVTSKVRLQWVRNPKIVRAVLGVFNGKGPVNSKENMVAEVPEATRRKQVKVRVTMVTYLLSFLVTLLAFSDYDT